jgi:hypothetical protein
MRTILFLVLFVLSCNIATVEEKKMDEKIQNLIVQRVHKEEGWKTNEVRVDEVDRLRRGSCSFYTAGNTVRPLSFQLNYAVLNGDTVVGLVDENAVSKIIDACGADASPGWWAEIVTRFHPDLGSGVVLQDATTKPAAVRKIQAVKREFKQPAFGSESGSKTVSFYLLEPESFAVYFIKAAKNEDGSVTVDRSPIH